MQEAGRSGGPGDRVAKSSGKWALIGAVGVMLFGAGAALAEPVSVAVTAGTGGAGAEIALHRLIGGATSPSARRRRR